MKRAAMVVGLFTVFASNSVFAYGGVSDRDIAAANECVDRRQISCNQNDRDCVKLKQLYRETERACPKSYGFAECIQASAKICAQVKELEKELERRNGR